MCAANFLFTYLREVPCETSCCSSRKNDARRKDHRRRRHGRCAGQHAQFILGCVSQEPGKPVLPVRIRHIAAQFVRRRRHSAYLVGQVQPLK